MVTIRHSAMQALGWGFVFAGTASCPAQDVGSKTWFEKTWSEASRWNPAQPLHIRVACEYHNFVDPAELQRLRAQVGGAKTGRERQRLDRMEWEAARPIIQWTADVCTDGAQLRYGCTDSAAGVGLHFALGKSTDWLLREGMLRIAPADMTNPEYGVRNYAETADQIVRITVWAGLGDSTPGGLRPVYSTIEGSKWEGGVSISGAPPALSIVRGRVAPVGLPSISGMTIQSRMLADEKVRLTLPLGSTEYVSWSTDETLGRPVVGQTRWLDGKGRVVQTMKLEKLEFVSAEELGRLMQTPADGDLDAWGHKLAVRTVQDVRPDHLSQVKIEHGVQTAVPLSIPLGQETASRRSVWFFSAIPVVLGGGAILLAWCLRKFR